MSDENLDPNDVSTKPLPTTVDPAAPTEPIDADLASTAPIAAAPATFAAPSKPTWTAPAFIIGAFALLLVLAVVVLPPLLADRADPTPSITPTLEAPTPTLTEEAPEETPEEEAPPVVVVPDPLPTELVPEPTEPPAEPEPTPTP